MPVKINSVPASYSYEGMKMYEYEIRNGIEKKSHLRMNGFSSDLIRYLSDDYSGGSTKALFLGPRSRSHHRKPKLKIRTGCRPIAIVRYTTG